MVAHPKFETIGADGEADRLDADGNPMNDFFCRRVDDIDRVRRSVGDEEEIVVENDGFEMGAEEGGMPDFGGRFGLTCLSGRSVRGREKPNTRDGWKGSDETKKKRFHGDGIYWVAVAEWSLRQASAAL